MDKLKKIEELISELKTPEELSKLMNIIYKNENMILSGNWYFKKHIITWLDENHPHYTRDLKLNSVLEGNNWDFDNYFLQLKEWTEDNLDYYDDTFYDGLRDYHQHIISEEEGDI